MSSVEQLYVPHIVRLVLDAIVANAQSPLAAMADITALSCVNRRLYHLVKHTRLATSAISFVAHRATLLENMRAQIAADNAFWTRLVRFVFVIALCAKPLTNLFAHSCKRTERLCVTH